MPKPLIRWEGLVFRFGSAEVTYHAKALARREVLFRQGGQKALQSEELKPDFVSIKIGKTLSGL